MSATQVLTYHLPESWAAAIVNDDWTGYEGNEIAIIESFFESELKENQYLVLWGDEPEFMWNHDARDYGWGGDNCIEFMLIQ